jgi:hypothetical protein
MLGERIAYIHLIVERQAFAEMSIVANDVGHVWSMIVHSTVTDVLPIHVKRRRKHHLCVIPASIRIRKHVGITSIITLQRRQKQGLKRHVQSLEKESG